VSTFPLAYQARCGWETCIGPFSVSGGTDPHGQPHATRGATSAVIRSAHRPATPGPLEARDHRGAPPDGLVLVEPFGQRVRFLTLRRSLQQVTAVVGRLVGILDLGTKGAPATVSETPAHEGRQSFRDGGMVDIGFRNYSLPPAIQETQSTAQPRLPGGKSAEPDGQHRATRGNACRSDNRCHGNALVDLTAASKGWRGVTLPEGGGDMWSPLPLVDGLTHYGVLRGFQGTMCTGSWRSPLDPINVVVCWGDYRSTIRRPLS
jgi:hypothetical protein